MGASDVQTSGKQIQSKEDPNFHWCEMPRTSNARPGCPQKSENERGHESLHHEPGVSDIWVGCDAAKII